MTSPIRVVGAGLTSFGRFDDRDVVSLAAEATIEALQDSGLQPSDVDAAYFGSAGDFGLGQRTMVHLGLGGLPIINVENACATSSTAFYLAQLALRAGEHQTVLVVGAHSYAPQRRQNRLGDTTALAQVDRDFAAGLTLPGIYAMVAQRHMAEHGTTPEQLALVSVKNHEHGLLNPKAQYRSALSVEDVLSSRVIADPLTLYQCCPRTDGAAALVLSNRPDARGPDVRACVLRTGAVAGAADEGSWGADIVAAAAAEAWERCGVSPLDVDVFEVHDAFTIGELVSYESLGLCKPGDAGGLVADRVTWLGGRNVVNASGGLLSRGHPVSATGAAMLVEITKQLRGRAGDYQVAGARLGVAETMGGGTAGMSGNACTITVLMAGQ